jgi:hypothetical protein
LCFHETYYSIIIHGVDRYSDRLLDHFHTMNFKRIVYFFAARLGIDKPFAFFRPRFV